MSILRIPGEAVRIVVWSFIIWIVLSTIIPQALVKYTNIEIQTNKYTKNTYPYNSLTSPTPLPIQNSTVYFIVGHPDDEVMFFSPSIIEISKVKYNNHVKLICFSNGDSVDESMGKIRSHELYESARILGISAEDVIVLEDEFKDGMNVKWDSNLIKQALVANVDMNDIETPKVFITFDESGVSNHPNHISLYYGTINFFNTYFKKSDNTNKLNSIFVLKSLNFWEKYSFTLLNNVELFVDHLSKLLINNILKLNANINITFFSKKNFKSASIFIYSDLNMLSVSYAAMSYGHFSQMVWFRYGWLILSRYLTYNHLIQLA
ncbi:N-acetylglucosaminyl phosphatidylinositol de-N-acetylase [Scheffersomyces amazonensis]|uniref:N-acetylglucosaminyl phosphatidylinositol de-N-acetylase n=1 Tax=Scheffersomyces amazonensis TaxID=1078765 RepID=UPI00315D8A74